MSDSSFDDLRDLYQEVILDHGRRPRHAGRMASFDATAKGDNPLCGDRVQVFVKFAPDGTIAETSFDARGCAISVASADLMAEVVAGRSKDDTASLFAAFRELARTGTCPHCDTAIQPAMERLEPLAGVHEYPSRVKCATLPWHTLAAALEGHGEATSEGGQP
jgi:nitrogen fixation NifU-like protein